MRLKYKKIIAREFILLLIVLTVGLLSFISIYLYNSYRKAESKKLNSEIISMSKQIDSLENSGTNVKEDQIKDLYSIIKGNKLFLDENDFRAMLVKDPSGTYSVVSKDPNAKDLFLDYSDFKNVLGLDKLDTSNVLKSLIDNNQLQILWDFDIKEGRHLSLEDLKKVVINPSERKEYFDEFNSKMGFKDYDEFSELLLTEKGRHGFRETKRTNDLAKVEKRKELQQKLDKLKSQQADPNRKILTSQEQMNFAFWLAGVVATVLFLFRYIFYSVVWSIRTLRMKENAKNM